MKKSLSLFVVGLCMGQYSKQMVGNERERNELLFMQIEMGG